MLVACDGPPANEQETENGVVKVDLPAPKFAPAPIDRSALLLAVIRAASASAAGQDDSAAQRELDGKAFELRIRFGCGGPTDSASDEAFGWSYDEGSRRLQLRASPDIARDDPFVQQASANQSESVEGFWIPRPWLLDPTCPATPAPPPSPDGSDTDAAASDPPPAETAAEDEEEDRIPSPSWPRVGIAQFFTAADSRALQRSDRPYRISRTIELAEADRAQGFTFILSGRLVARPGGRVITCVAADPQSPPDCLISARFDRVWIEQPATGTLIAEWGTG